MRSWKIQLASSCGWSVPRNTLFSRRQLRIARSVVGISTGDGVPCRRRDHATPWTTPYTMVSTSSVSVSQTSTCFATSTVSAGVTATIVVAHYAAAMIDEAQRLFDVGLAIARLRVIFADHAAQRSPDLLVRGGLRYTQRFIQRRSHRLDGMPKGTASCRNLRGNHLL